MQQERTVFNKVKTDVAEDGGIVTERAESTKVNTDPKTTVSNMIWYVYGFIAVVLALRFIMKLSGANSDNAFVSLVYGISGVLSAPFDTIFGVVKPSSGNYSSVFEPSILVAAAVYALIAWGIVKLLTLNEPRSEI